MIEVYCIEDDETIAQAVEAFLNGKNCNVTVLPTIAKAQNAMISHVPSIVLVD